ncbi:MAG: hypothetical protein WCK02_16080 [Bacteroidota bacterium]
MVLIKRKLTEKGRKYSHFSLLVEYRPNAKYRNPKFTYRGDDKLVQFNSTKGQQFKTEIEALEYQAIISSHNAAKMTLWDNSMVFPNNIYKMWIEGVVVEDHSKQYIIGKDDIKRIVTVQSLTYETK